MPQTIWTPRMQAMRRLIEGEEIVQRSREAQKLVLDFIKKHEGYRQKAYWDDIGKKWTVGHGHTYMKDPVTGKMRAVAEGDEMDEATSSSLVSSRLRDMASQMYTNLKWSRYLSPKALAAMLDVAYNSGVGTLYPDKSPNLNKSMNAPGADRDAIVWRELPTYRTSGGRVVKGLENRRADARTEFGPQPQQNVAQTSAPAVEQPAAGPA